MAGGHRAAETVIGHLCGVRARIVDCAKTPVFALNDA